MEKQSDLLLDIQHLHTAYRLQGKFYDAADDINLTLKRDEILAVVGESGCGKSTIAASIIGLYDHKNTKVTGDILYNELNLVGLNESLFNKIRGDKIGMIFQDPLASLNPLMRVGDQVAETLYYHTDMDEKARHARVIELFNQVGMPKPEEMYAMYPHELSGGLRQRVVIAMAIACKPEIIIADEPTTALDVTIQAQILDLLENLKKKIGSSIMLITHDLGVVAGMADYVVVMYAGRVIEKGTADDIFHHPAHPYTIGLMKSKPVVGKKVEELYNIPGSVPNPVNMPNYCYFRDRCEMQCDMCSGKYPPSIRISDTHVVSCYRFYDEKNVIEYPKTVNPEEL